MDKQYSESHSLKQRITLLSVGISTILAFMIAGASFQYFRATLKESQAQAGMSSLQLLGADIDSAFESVLSFANWITVDSTIDRYLREMPAQTGTHTLSPEYRSMSVSAWNHFYAEFNATVRTGSINRAVISTADGGCFLQCVKNASVTSPRELTELIMAAPFFEEQFLSETLILSLQSNPLNSFYDKDMIPIIRPIYSSASDDRTGFLYMELSPDILLNSLSTLELAGDAHLFVRFTRGETFRYDPETRTLVSAVPPEGCLTGSLKTGGLSLLLEPSQSYLHTQLRYYLHIVLLLFVSILLSGVFLSLQLNRMINEPIKQLLSRLKSVSSGEFHRDPGIEWPDELGSIGTGINDLAESIHELMEKKLQDEKNRQELEYRILQSQINPHFLYNTLNTIKWMATIQGSDGIADMATALSRLLKNIAKSREDLIPLSAELDLVKDYFTIMKYRYGGTISLALDIRDDALLDCPVNRFSLQPLVENAIFHGIEPKGGAGTITIRVFEENALIIEVEDNGVGMDEETITRILTTDSPNEKNDFFRHVGFRNVDNRIRFCFGDAYGLSIHSSVGNYTIIRLTLPEPAKNIPSQGEDHDLPASDR